MKSAVAIETQPENTVKLHTTGHNCPHTLMFVCLFTAVQCNHLDEIFPPLFFWSHRKPHPKADPQHDDDRSGAQDGSQAAHAGQRQEHRLSLIQNLCQVYCRNPHLYHVVCLCTAEPDIAVCEPGASSPF